MPPVKNGKVAGSLSVIHARLFAIYVMMSQGKAADVNMDVFKRTLNELEALYADTVPEW